MKRLIAILLCFMLIPLDFIKTEATAELRELRVITDRFEGTAGGTLTGWKYTNNTGVTYSYAADPTGAQNSVAKLDRTAAASRVKLRRELGNIGNGKYYFGDMKIKFRVYKESGNDRLELYLRQYNPTSDKDTEGDSLFAVFISPTETGKWYDATLTVRKSGTYDFELKDGNTVVASSSNVEFNSSITGFWQLDFEPQSTKAGVWYLDDFFLYINEETGFDNETALKEVLSDDFNGTIGENRTGWSYSTTIENARYVCAPDPKNAQETVLKLNRSATGEGNRVKMYQYLAGGAENAITDDMLITFRAYDEDGTGRFNFILRAPDADGEGDQLVTVDLMQICTPGMWYDCFVEIKNNGEGEKSTWSMWMVSEDEKITPYKNKEFTNRGICRLDFEENYSKLGDWYIDDLKVYTDHRSELLAASNELTFEDIAAGNLQDEVLGDLNLISEIEYDGDVYPIIWESSDKNFISDNGEVERHSFSQEVTLTAKVCMSDDTDLYIKKEIAVTVYKDGDSTDEKIIEDYINFYLKESLFTDEEPTSLTKNLKSALPTTGPEGMTISWVSDNDAINIDGTVTRPAYGNGNAFVTLTAQLDLNGAQGTTELVYTVLQRPDPYIDINATISTLTYELLSNEDSGRITKDLYLPTKGEGNAIIDWVSTEPLSIEVDRENECGKVIRGDSEAEVTLTAIVSNDGESDDTSVFTFIVLPTIQKIFDIDMEPFISDFENTPEFSDGFELPLVGETYGTKFVWEVMPESRYLVVDGNRAIVYCPPFDVGDVEVNLVLTATYAATEETFTYPIKILCEGTNEDIVSVVKGEMAEFSAISSEESSSVTQNLALVTKKSGVDISWELTSGAEGVVSLPDGEITRPLPGEEPENITLTATFNRGDVTDTQTYTFTVTPFENDVQVLSAEKEALLFSKLSSEDIKAITQNLSLPQNGKYGATITWSSTSKHLVVNGAIGVVTRPKWGETNALAPLTATISYNGIPDTKTFNIEILEKNYMEVEQKLWSEDFEGWTADNSFVTTGATWNKPAAEEAAISLEKDPLDSENNVLKIDRTGSTGTGYLIVSAPKAVSGIVYMGIRFYYPAGSTIAISGRTADCDQVPVRINSSGVTATGYFLPDAQVNVNDWNKLDLIIDVNTERYQVKFNDVLCSPYEEGEGQDEEENSFSDGIPYNYYGQGRNTTIQSFRMNFSKNDITYIDDLSMENKILYTNAQLNLADAWEQEFLANNDIMALKSTIVFPSVWADGVRVFYYSDNSNILDTAGMIQLPSGEADVIFKVGFSDGFTEYIKSYNIHVIKTEQIPLTDEEAAQADLAAAVKKIKESGMLSNLTNNLTMPGAVGENGSSITVVSSNTSALANDGTIDRKNTDTTLTLTVKAVKNGIAAQEILNVVVAKKEIVTTGTTPSDTGGGGGGGGGIKVTYGEQTKGDTGIDIIQPDEENSTNTQFKDITEEHWAYDEIKYLVDKGIMSGVGNGMMEPQRTIRREEFIKLLVSAMGIDTENAKTEFTDVDENGWYAPYITAAKENGLITGYDDGTVGIGKEITRQDMAVMIFRAAKLTSMEGESLFPDHSSISHYAIDAVYTLQQNGVINGMDNGKFAPMEKATRAETACMLYKAITKGLFAEN